MSAGHVQDVKNIRERRIGVLWEPSGILVDYEMTENVYGGGWRLVAVDRHPPPTATIVFL